MTTASSGRSGRPARSSAGWLARPELVLARLELTLAATRDEELAAAMAGWRAQLVELVRRTLQAGGRPDDATRAATVVAALDGVLLAALQRPARQRSGLPPLQPRAAPRARWPSPPDPA